MGVLEHGYAMIDKGQDLVVGRMAAVRVSKARE